MKQFELKYFFYINYIILIGREKIILKLALVLEKKSLTCPQPIYRYPKSILLRAEFLKKPISLLSLLSNLVFSTTKNLGFDSAEEAAQMWGLRNVHGLETIWA